MLTAPFGGSGGRPIVTGICVEEPDIEIGAGVSSKAISRRMQTDKGGNQGPRSSREDDNPNHMPPAPTRGGGMGGDRGGGANSFRRGARGGGRDTGRREERERDSRPGNGNEEPVILGFPPGITMGPNGINFPPGFNFGQSGGAS
jgi:protein NRD1